jgi:hypothetical protein
MLSSPRKMMMTTLRYFVYCCCCLCFPFLSNSMINRFFLFSLTFFTFSLFFVFILFLFIIQRDHSTRKYFYVKRGILFFLRIHEKMLFFSFFLLSSSNEIWRQHTMRKVKYERRLLLILSSKYSQMDYFSFFNSTRESNCDGVLLLRLLLFSFCCCTNWHAVMCLSNYQLFRNYHRIFV